MTNQEKIYKIAEYCGAKWYRLCPSDDFERSLSFDDLNMKGKGLSFATGNETIVQIHHLPDYINDLNAMYEAEKMLSKEEWVIYGQHLNRLNVFPMVHATAEQRADAFISTIDEKNTKQSIKEEV